LQTDELDAAALSFAERWCNHQGNEWSVLELLGRGGTAPVFRVRGPQGDRALKVLDPRFSEGELGRQTEIRIEQQIELGDHGCPNLVTCYDGGKFEEKLFLLMSLAEGQELEKKLGDIPRSKIRNILDQITRAAIFLRSKNMSHRDIKSANIFVSEDFERATLLDLSVLRDINDPVGIGTDHDNQLPVVATSRYTPPEYLFRLQDPSPDLWHGVDIYQLGGLLHDLIMREPMFTSEYAASSENRYRFAWIVATIDPLVKAADVDTDLVLLARRALDKNWERRRRLRLQDFLIEGGNHAPSLAAIGIAPTPRPPLIPPTTPRPAELADLARLVDDHVLAFLTQRGQRATHSNTPGKHDLARLLRWEWRPGTGDVADQVELEATLEFRLGEPYTRICTSITFKAWIDDDPCNATLELPEFDYIDGIHEDVAQQIFTSLGPLATGAMSARRRES